MSDWSILINIGGDKEGEKSYLYIHHMYARVIYVRVRFVAYVNFSAISSFSGHIIQSVDLPRSIPPRYILGIRVPSGGIGIQ
jgi:hypothetical protein